jgi:hypothetical protein
MMKSMVAIALARPKSFPESRKAAGESVIDKQIRFAGDSADPERSVQAAVRVVASEREGGCSADSRQACHDDLSVRLNHDRLPGCVFGKARRHLTARAEARVKASRSRLS